MTEKIKAIIIDDELDALDTIRIKLEIYCKNVQILASCDSPDQGIKAIMDHQPDLIFLDIEMPRMNGFELLERLGENIDFDIVFVTAYDRYAIKAFKVQALDYLLKPVDKDDLIACIQRIQKRSRKFNKAQLNDLLAEMENAAAEKKVLLHGKTSVEIVAEHEIIYLKAEGSYCKVFTIENRHIIVTKSLNELEKLLDPKKFFRIHRTYTTNLDQIKKVSLVQGQCEVILKNDETLPVSRRKKDELYEAITKLGRG